MRQREESQARPPAAGERAAVSGYSVQYRTSAALTLAALRDESLEWIALVDPDAGTLDDFQLARRGRLDAYQVKFSGATGAFTFTRLKNIIGELADGWDRLRKANPDREVFAHLHTSQQPSRHAAAGPVADPPPSPKHFAGFLDAVWLPVLDGRIRATTAIPGSWGPVWDALRAETGFGKRDFLNFVRHLRLDLGQVVPDADAGDLRVDPDLKRRYQELLWVQQQIVTDASRRTHMTRDELLQELGWTEEFEFRSVHEFAIRRDRYARNAASADGLLDAIGGLPSGYVALVGTPGSGKSTVLTDTFYGHEAVVARYYAYVPDNEIGRLTRASAVNFLHDVVLSLDRAGIHIGQTPVSFDVDVLAERLRRQLQALGERYVETGQRAYLVVDGLDHVERALRPGSARESLLDRLPDPAEIPTGVFLVLGTQRIDVAPEPVRTQLAERGRVVQMSPLERADVLRLASGSGVVPAGAEETVYSLSNGHPLIVAYLLSGLEGIDESERAAWLVRVPPVDGDVLALYRAYWSDVEADDDTVYALAHITRWRGPIDLEWFASWLDPIAIQRIRRSAHHFFRRESRDRWYFFHESFRVFLLDTTIQTGDGVTDDRIAFRYHWELAVACARADRGRVRWEQLHHLIEAGEEEAALELAEPAAFRTQAQALRSLPAIAGDIREATRVAVRQRSLVALARLMIAASELGQRQYHLGWSDNLALLLIELDREEIALDHLRGDFTLRESKDVALRAAHHLHLRGFHVEARRLFDLAEPLDLLRNQPEHYSRADAEIDTLCEWAQVAPFFVPLARVVDQIDQLSDASFGSRWRDDRDVTRHYRAQLRAFAGVGALAAGMSDAVDELLGQFDRDDNEQATAWARLVMHRFRVESQSDIDSARERLEAALAEADMSQIAGWMRVRIGEELFRLGDPDGSRRWIEEMEPPATPEDAWGGEGASRFMPVLHYYRLRAAVGSAVNPENAVGEPRNSHYTLVHRGWRAIISLANLWGACLRDEPPETADAVAEMGAVMATLDRRPSRDDLGWYAFREVRPELLALLVDAADAVGADTLEAVKSLFLERWLAQNPPDDDEVRRVLMAFHGLVGPEPWIRGELARHEPTMLQNKDVNGQINACFAQARAWLQLDDRDSAMRNTLTGVERSAGVGYRKDYSLNSWIELMSPLMREPGGDAEIIWLAQTLPGLDESTEGRASALAAEELLRQTSAAHPAAAVRILRTLPREGVIDYAGALAAFLEGLRSVPYDEHSWRCLSEVLVACADSAEPAALRALANATQPESLRFWLRALNERVAVHAVPTSRLYWRRAIAEVAAGRGLALHDLGLTADDLEPSERAPRSHREEPSSSEHSPADEVTNAQELVALVDGGAESDYHLRAAVDRVADLLDRNHILRLRDALAGGRREPLILARLARRLASLGDSATARALAEDALGLGSRSGWIAYIDGGTRIRPLQALAEIDPAVARERFWEILASDAGDDSFNVGGLLDSFAELVGIADAEQALAVAMEARDYAHELLATVTTIDALADASDLAGADVPAACACVLIDSALTDDAIRADAGARGAVDAAEFPASRVIEQLRASLDADTAAARRALHIIAAAALSAGPETGRGDERSALHAMATGDDRHERELADALVEETRGNELDTTRLEEAGVALIGLVHRPAERPLEIAGAAPRDVRDTEWTAAVSRSAREVPSAINNGLILGEFTTLTRLAWELPTVRRQQATVHVGSEGRVAVPFLMDLPMLHYHRIADVGEIAEELGEAIVFNFTEPGDDPWSSLGAALSPSVALRLDWRPSSGLFAWEDAEGHPTCWSLWWRDGHRDRRPPSFDDVVGEGWLVIATPAAVAAIRTAIGPVERLVTVTHTIAYRSESEEARLPVLDSDVSQS